MGFSVLSPDEPVSNNLQDLCLDVLFPIPPVLSHSSGPQNVSTWTHTRGRAAPGGFAEMVEDSPGLQHSLGEVGTGVSSPHHVFISKDPLAATLWPQFSSHLCISDFLNKVQNKL